MPIYRARRPPFAALLLIATLPFTSQAAAPAAAFQKPLPPQPLSDALLTLAEKFNILLIYRTELSDGVISKGAPAGLSLDATLRAVLEGTGLTYELVDGRSVVVYAKREDAHRNNPRPSGDGLPKPARPARSSGSTASQARQSDRSGSVEPWNQVIVPGTHIPGQKPVGAHLTTLTRDDLYKRAYANVADAIRALPQNFGGGPSEDTWYIGQEETYNTSRGWGLNLRGLGSGSTLVLVNGRRLAAGGGDGRFVDVSGIPLSAIERIDVLPDGASAVYGADAVGGVVNFQLRQNYDGADTQVRFGTSTLDAPNQFQAAQTWGKTWTSGNVLTSLDYYQRSEVPAADRRQSRDSDLSTLGGNNFDILEGNPGTLISSSGMWGIPHGQNGSALTAADLKAGEDKPNLHNRNEGMDLLPDQRRASLVTTLNQQIGEDVHLFADLLRSQRNTEVVLGPTRMTLIVPSTNAFYVNPTGGTDPVRVTYSFARDLGPENDHSRVTTTSATLGADLKMNRWMITPAVSFAAYQERIDGGPFVDQAVLAKALADPNPETAFNPFGDGSFTNPVTLEGLRLKARLDRDTKLRSFNIAANRTLETVLDRELKVALGAEVRRERLDSLGVPSAFTLINWHDKRTVNAAYAELLLPIFDEHHQQWLLESLRLSVAARYDDYSDFGHRTTPRYGLNWSPLPGLTFRGSWSESFKAPSLVERDTSRNFSVLTSLLDASSHLSQVLLWFGTNPELEDEKAKTWTLGADFTVPSQGLSFALTYFNLKYRDRIDRIDFSPNILDDRTLAPFVTRNLTPEQHVDLCMRGHFLGDVNYCLATPIDAFIDLRLDNIALMTTEGLDVSMEYVKESRFGTFEAALNATYVNDFSKARSNTSPLTNYVDRVGYPLRFRGKADLLWERGAFSVMGTLNYSDSYRDTVSSPERFVHPWTTVDFGVRYRLNDVTFDLNTQNLFNKRPPFVNNAIGVGYDPENADLLGRFISLGVRKEW